MRARACAPFSPSAIRSGAAVNQGHPRAGADGLATPLRGASASVILARDARSCFPLPLGGEGRVRGAAGATSSLWVRPPSAFDSACAVRPPPLLDPLPRRGRGIRKRACAPFSPSAIRSGAAVNQGHPRAGADGLATPLRGASASVILARAARSCLPLPLGGEGRVRGAAGATSSLWVRPPSSFDSACAVRPPPLLDPLPRRGRGIRKRGCATRVPAAMQWPRAGVTSSSRTPHCCHSRARC